MHCFQFHRPLALALLPVRSPYLAELLGLSLAPLDELLRLTRAAFSLGLGSVLDVLAHRAYPSPWPDVRATLLGGDVRRESRVELSVAAKIGGEKEAVLRRNNQSGIECETKMR